MKILDNFDNIKFHFRCLFRIQRLLLQKKIRFPEYFRKSNFFISGILRVIFNN